MGMRQQTSERTALLACGVLLLGCSSYKNYAERRRAAGPAPECCVDSCQTDPGSAPPSCARQLETDRYEYLSVVDFESGVATNMYTYDDGSGAFLSNYDEATGTFPAWVGFQAPAVADAGVCGSRYAFNLRGGPFRSWGGGMGVSMRWIWEKYCQPGTADYRADADFCPAGSEVWSTKSLDLSHWEGLSFWARRGPDGQSGLRAMVGDRITDDDISFLSYQADPLAPRSCERLLTCGCDGDTPCTPVGNVSYCFDPATDPAPGADLGCGRVATYDLCGQSACDQPYSAYPDSPDPQFFGTPCALYSFRGGIQDLACYDAAAGEHPAENSEKCGDNWFAPVTVSGDWAFYRVPFTDMHQQGWAMESWLLDLTAVTLVRLTFDRGYVDYWIDDLGFYRRTRE
jgi:hypothetical protein